MPTPVIASERMQLVNDHHSDIAEEAMMVDLLRDQQHFEGLGGRQQAIRLLGDNPPAFALGRVTVPERRSPTDQPQVLVEPLLLVVQQCLDRADVEDRDARPCLFEHLRDHGEECRLGFSSRCGREDHQVRAGLKGLDRQRLNLSQLSPAE